MRISTTHYQNQAVSSILETQGTLAKLQEQASTGRRVNRPSDDPLAAAEVERLRAGQARNDIEKRMMSYAKNQMALSENSLGAGIDILQRARDLMINARNGAMTDIEHAVLGSQLQQLRSELLDLANTKNNEGDYVFGGQGSEQAPFSPSGDPVFQGMPGTRQNGFDTPLDLTLNGDQVFTGFGPGGNRTIFQELDAVAEALGAGDRAALEEALTRGMMVADNALERFSVTRSLLGEQRLAIDARENLLASGDLGAAQRRSELVDTDYASVLSGIQSRDLALRAAMQTYSQISQLSMFNYL
ncbi:MAG: flagellar hook-associated protein FlgL [Lautropia sp.]|nr:flagellar hook-associated protein FlgL [Lautropia sp.]